MRTSNGQFICTEDHLVPLPDGLLITDLKKGQPLGHGQLKFLEDVTYHLDPSKSLDLVDTSEKEFIEWIQFIGRDEIIRSLMMIHDLALYHTDVCFDTPEKNALFNLKVLCERLGDVEMDREEEKSQN